MAHPLALRKEKDVLREILLYLRARGVFHIRINTMGVFDFSRKIYMKSPNTTLGVSDIIILKAGKMICLEAKSPTGKQSPEQKQFEQNVKRNGGEYYLVRCVQDVINVGI